MSEFGRIDVLFNSELVPVVPEGPRELGRDVGRFLVSDDFKELLLDDLLDSFEGW